MTLRSLAVESSSLAARHLTGLHRLDRLDRLRMHLGSAEHAARRRGLAQVGRLAGWQRATGNGLPGGRLPDEARSVVRLAQTLVETPAGRVPRCRPARIEYSDGPHQIDAATASAAS